MNKTNAEKTSPRLKKIFGSLFLPFVVAVVITALLWLTALLVNEPIIFPSPAETLREFFGFFSDRNFYTAFFNTLLRSLITFALCFVLAFVCAVGAKSNRFFKRIADMLMSVVRALPTIAVILLLLLWTTKKIAPMIVVSLVVLPNLFSAIYTLFLGIDENLIEMCCFYGVSKKTVLLKVKIPLILPDMLRCMGNNLALTLKLTVAAEVLARTGNALGRLMLEYQTYFETAKLTATVLVTVIVGLLTEYAFGAAAKRTEKGR